MPPKIYNTEIPSQLEKLLSDNESKVITLSAATGTGKTFCLGRILGKLCSPVNPGIIVFPYRVSVRSMHSFHLKMNEHEDLQEISVGYAMRGKREINENNTVHLMTVGYYLEILLNQGIEENCIIAVDEAHDTSWQTDLTLRYLFYLMEQGRKFTVIISTATTLPKHMIPKDTFVHELKVKTEKRNVVSRFLKRKPTNYSEFSSSIFKDIYHETDGNLLIILPGEKDIFACMECIENIKLDDLAIVTLFSKMEQEDIQESLEFSIHEGKRILMLATNMVENSITLDNLNVVIDFCQRKVMEYDEDGISCLKLTSASKDNLIQSSGRCGRLGKTGYAYFMITEEEYELLEDCIPNEVERSPPYRQIIKLSENDLNYYDVLSHINKDKLDNSVEYLKEKYILDPDGKVTEIGSIAAKLNMSIRAGSFMAHCMMDPDCNLFFATWIATWIDHNYVFFYYPRRNYGEDKYNYSDRLSLALEHHAEFKQFDCLTTDFFVWARSWTDDFETMYKWCKENSLSKKSLTTFEKSLEMNINNVSSLIKGNIPSENPLDMYEDLIREKDNFKSILMKTNRDRFASKTNMKIHGHENLSFSRNIIVPKNDFFVFNIRLNPNNGAYYIDKLVHY